MSPESPQKRRLRHSLMPAKRLEKMLNPNSDGGLGDVIRRARAMGELASALANALPSDLAPGVVAANVRNDGELVVICPSSAWASRLRFETDRLVSAARGTGADVKTCTVKVSQRR